MTTRLDTLAPQVAERFRAASRASRQRAIEVACRLAASSAELAEDCVKQGLGYLRNRSGGDARALAAEVGALATSHDDEYLRLSEAGKDASAARTAFSRARAAAALVAGPQDADTHWHEAIYEAAMAREDPAELLSAVADALEMPTLLSLVGSLGVYDDDQTIYAVAPWRGSSRVVVALEPPDGGLPAAAVEVGATYFLEVFIAAEFLDGWSRTDGQGASPEEACERLIAYAMNDA